MMYDWGGGGLGLGMILGPLFMLVLVAIAAWIVAAIFRSSGFGALPGGPPRTGPSNGALARLKPDSQVRLPRYEKALFAVVECHAETATAIEHVVHRDRPALLAADAFDQ